MACVVHSKGPVLEIGVGHYSTPCLHAVCEVLGRNLVSVEANPEWLAQFTHYTTDRHKLDRQTDATLDELAMLRWGVVFVDDLGGETRVKRLEKFFNSADYMLFHDYQFPQIKEDLDRWLEGKHRFTRVYDNYQPHTLIVSKDYPIPAFAP